MAKQKFTMTITNEEGGIIGVINMEHICCIKKNGEQCDINLLGGQLIQVDGDKFDALYQCYRNFCDWKEVQDEKENKE